MNRVDVVRELYRAFRERDDARLFALCTEDLEWRQNPGFPGGGVHHGVEAVVRRIFAGFAGAWSSFSFEPESMNEVDDVVFVTGVYRARARTSGREVVCEACHVYTFRGPRICRFQQYADTWVLQEALRGG